MTTVILIIAIAALTGMILVGLKPTYTKADFPRYTRVFNLNGDLIKIVHARPHPELHKWAITWRWNKLQTRTIDQVIITDIKDKNNASDNVEVGIEGEVIIKRVFGTAPLAEECNLMLLEDTDTLTEKDQKIGTTKCYQGLINFVKGRVGNIYKDFIPQYTYKSGAATRISALGHVIAKKVHTRLETDEELLPYGYKVVSSTTPLIDSTDPMIKEAEQKSAIAGFKLDAVDKENLLKLKQAEGDAKAIEVRAQGEAKAIELKGAAKAAAASVLVSSGSVRLEDVPLVMGAEDAATTAAGRAIKDLVFGYPNKNMGGDS